MNFSLRRVILSRSASQMHNKLIRPCNVSNNENIFRAKFSNRFFSRRSDINSIFKQSESYLEQREKIEQERAQQNDDTSYKLEDIDLKQIQDLKSLDITDDIIDDYTLLLKSIREKKRLTIDWTDIRDDDMAAVHRVAKRVGLKLDTEK